MAMMMIFAQALESLMQGVKLKDAIPGCGCIKCLVAFRHDDLVAGVWMADLLKVPLSSDLTATITTTTGEQQKECA